MLPPITKKVDTAAVLAKPLQSRCMLKLSAKCKQWRIRVQHHDDLSLSFALHPTNANVHGKMATMSI